MCNAKVIYRLAGSIVLASITLGVLVHPYWLALAVFAGANLVQFSFTGFCPAEWIFGRLEVMGCKRRRV